MKVEMSIARTGSREKSYHTAQKLDSGKSHYVEFTLESKTGKNCNLVVDFAEKTITCSNRLFKVVWMSWAERDYNE